MGHPCMLRTYFLLSMIALGSSFCLSLLMGFGGRSLLVAGITLFSTLLGFLLTERRRIQEARARFATVNQRIRTLHQKGAHLHHKLLDMLDEKQQLTTSLTHLQQQIQQLQAQAKQRWAHSQQLGQSVSAMQIQKYQLEDEIRSLELQRQQHSLPPTERMALPPASQPHPLQPAVQQLQAQVTSLRQELEHLETQILERRSQKAALDQQLAILQTEQPVIELLPAIANGKFDALKLEQAVNTPDLAYVTAEVIPQPISYKIEPHRRSHQEVHRATSATAVITAPALPTLPTRPIASPPIADVPPLPVPTLPDDWTAFILQLPEHEVTVLEAIATANQPNVVLKQMAETHLTMPEVIIDAINERAIETIGDVIIEPGAGSTPPTLLEEHRDLVQQAIAVYHYLAN